MTAFGRRTSKYQVDKVINNVHRLLLLLLLLPTIRIYINLIFSYVHLFFYTRKRSSG